MDVNSEQICYFHSSIQNGMEMMHQCIEVLDQQIQNVRSNEIKSVQKEISSCIKSNFENGEEIFKTKNTQRKIVKSINQIKIRLDENSEAHKKLGKDYSEFKDCVEISVDKLSKSNEKMFEVIDSCERRISFTDFLLNDGLDDVNKRLNLIIEEVSQFRSFFSIKS